MKSRDGPVTEEDLHARVDGQLPPERATAVEAYLAAHPKKRDRWRQYAEQRQMLREAISAQTDRDIPARLRIFIRDRPALVREAFRLEYLTLAWMVIEAAVAIGSGVAAHSITLLAFGIDSLIELASAVVLIWRLTIELRRGDSFAKDAERKASRIGGALLFALAAYVVAAAARSLWTRQGQDFSLPGLAVSLIALPLMWVLSRRKLRLAEPLGSRALRTDAVESIACGWLSFVVVIGLLAQLVLGKWWVDPITSLAILWLLIKEGREAWEGEDDD